MMQSQFILIVVEYLTKPVVVSLSLLAQEKLSLKKDNPDFCSVFKSELIAIDVGFEAILSKKNYSDLWIITESRSSLQHLRKWFIVGNKIKCLHLTQTETYIAAP
ncbi:hypothetical protein TNCV_3645931 [Trichonephila clavipes]|nr:hypothetical protein TNCV_3645931 [Trichonephila clavipes]